LLGGWLAQRQAALRDVMAAGSLPTFTLGLPCLPMISRAACVPRKRFFWKVRAIGSKERVANALRQDAGDNYQGLASTSRDISWTPTTLTRLCAGMTSPFDDSADQSSPPTITVPAGMSDSSTRADSPIRCRSRFANRLRSDRTTTKPPSSRPIPTIKAMRMVKINSSYRNYAILYKTNKAIILRQLPDLGFKSTAGGE
jgi:hypothetical protein